ncbi:MULTISPECIES: antitoxin [Carnobacterium]|uniref:antitoxin n=1 Tax=Carnobacterium TaxID=2747 RepID=UPI001DBE8FA1|nr:antitoxin [Carnobacterium maltaromaticum]MCC4313476.1 hypothetical protein [Carnobacterium maltaromaticum]
MGELKIRKVSQKTIAGIDDLAKKARKSREGYLRDLIRNHVESAEVMGVKNDYEDLVKIALQVVESNTEAIKKFNSINEVY